MSRIQYVHYNGCNSSTKSIEYGVPQGSILEPLFFILFMNDFSRASQLFFSIRFADDTSVFLIGKEYTQLIVSLNEELKKVSRWLNANGPAIFYISKIKYQKTVGLFYKMRQYLERKALTNLYYSLVFPYLIYCNEVWGNASAVHLEPIIKIQREPSEQLHSLAIYHLLNPFFNL